MIQTFLEHTEIKTNWPAIVFVELVKLEYVAVKVPIMIWTHD